MAASLAVKLCGNDPYHRPRDSGLGDIEAGSGVRADGHLHLPVPFAPLLNHMRSIERQVRRSHSH